MIARRVIVTSSGPVILSDKAAAFMAKPAPIMGFVEDIYSIAAASTGWYVVHTASQHEERVIRKLDEKRIEAYLPQTIEWKPRTRSERDQRKPLEAISRPLLSRYLFAKLPADERAYRLVQDIDGVREILGHGERKIALPIGLVDFIRQREDAGDFNRTEKRGRVVSPKWAREGVNVTITDGPFSGFLATIQKCLPRNQVEVVVTMFGRPTTARMELEQVRERA